MLEGLTATSAVGPPSCGKSPSQHCLARLMEGWTPSVREEMSPGLRWMLGCAGWSWTPPPGEGKVLELEQLDSDLVSFIAQPRDLR